MLSFFLSFYPKNPVNPQNSVLKNKDVKNKFLSGKEIDNQL